MAADRQAVRLSGRNVLIGAGARTPPTSVGGGWGSVATSPEASSTGDPGRLQPQGGRPGDGRRPASPLLALRMALDGRQAVPGGPVHHSDRGVRHACGSDRPMERRLRRGPVGHRTLAAAAPKGLDGPAAWGERALLQSGDSVVRRAMILSAALAVARRPSVRPKPPNAGTPGASSSSARLLSPRWRSRTGAGPPRATSRRAGRPGPVLLDVPAFVSPAEPSNDLYAGWCKSIPATVIWRPGGDFR
jgi:hypothetical protein